MSADQQGVSTPGSVNVSLDRLLARVSEVEQPAVLHDLAVSLENESDLVIANWLLSKVATGEDDAVKNAVRAFLVRMRDRSPTVVSDFCIESDQARELLIQSVLDALAEALRLLRSQHELRDVEDDKHPPSEERSASKASAHAVDCLKFLQQLYHSMLHQNPKGIDQSVQQLALEALDCPDQETARAARNLVSLWLRETCAMAGKFNTSTDSLREESWKWILQHAGECGTPQYSIAFSLWLHWIDLWRDYPEQHYGLLQSDQIWTLLQNALIDGDTEIRRNALLIIRKTVQLAF
ncbi:6-phosphofructokinase [Sphaceloma murrayae]|uniref:6-phosphofructokinase n=1 Tax=Sphaceloma murrayae TaxID=2082308 RepID=A0A2K1QW76_9PEZI|nr:6-phosphofructokinase [Sphaceloma murrayae]